MVLTDKLAASLVVILQAYPRNNVKKAFILIKHRSVEIIEFRENHRYDIEVESESVDGFFYVVNITMAEKKINATCDCPAFEKALHCKHVAAGMIEIIFKGSSLDVEDIEALVYEQLKPQAKGIPQAAVLPFTKEEPEKLTGKENLWHTFISRPEDAFMAVYRMSDYSGPTKHNLKKINLLEEEDRHWRFVFKGQEQSGFYPEITYDGEKTFRYRCTCHTDELMCAHVKFSFDWLELKHDVSYFTKYRDWTKEKNRLLQKYGLTLEDKEAKDIEFFQDYYGDLQMKVPGWLWANNAEHDISDFTMLFNKTRDEKNVPERPKPLKDTIIDFQVGFLFNFLSQHFKIGFELEPIRVMHKSGGIQFKKLTLHNPANLSLLKELPDDIYYLLTDLSDEALRKYMITNGHAYLGNYASPWIKMMDNSTADLQRAYLARLHKLWPYLAEHNQVFVLNEGSFSTKNITPAKLSADTVTLSYAVREDEKFITIWQQLLKHDEHVTSNDIRIDPSGIIFIDSELHILSNPADFDIMMKFRHGRIRIPVNNKLSVLTSVIPTLQEKFKVELPPSLTLKTVEAEPKPQVLLRECQTQYLMLQPQFTYETVTVDYESNGKNILQTLPDGSWQLIQRNLTKEKAFFEQLRPLHHRFENQKQNDFFYLPFDEVMKKNWFLETVRTLQENDITVCGLKELKKFRYNTSKPTWEMKVGSGVDWFDLHIKISFGEQEVPLKDVRKALFSKQNMVVLGDGTIGILPEEWLQQYGLLLKIGNQQKEGSLRLSKLHYTLIDELHDKIDDQKLLEEINIKKQKLRQIDQVKSVDISPEIKATLRPYQQSGFQWMQVLDELGWGGCLADDMGLGKTLQAIVFLQYLKEKYPGRTHLVVCPTSLIYNWENELKKFAPSLSYHIYYGSAREFSNEHFEDYDIVISSYGIIRNDLEHLLQFEWHYVILDESQAIKNPDALTTKAVQLLKSKNRIILSGTPVQNNTFDLYAQFNFINPGLLGNREFYKEFSNGIDKYNDQEKAAQLRKIVYPFMLRRTKEQVAKDLPDKTEMVLWCEMDKEQRSVYDDYKNHYRTTLLKKIEDLGMGGAGMYILEGLLRLRQICDSPQLVKSDEVKTTSSVKIDELMREVQENTGQHKLLVFSQFTEMLQLIRDRMDAAHIEYAYLDGSTTAVNRKKAVDEFQNNAALKIFLISLKAGGVGLNLTAADYVYLVDPWWNPAVEQQAIDRTHRIGQTNKIFAYRMICKNTIEEKIIALQQKKKQIASELVTEDAGFIKKLNKEDIEFLFN